jgi:acetoin utilization deacetylase AcuC-like enzyme
LARRVLVIDCDLHQGDGTASIFADDDRVFTFSIHNEQAFPAVKQQSDLDIPLRAGTGTDLYLKSLAAGLSWIPDERFDVIIYQAGIDIHENDQLGGLRVSAEGIATRDRLVRDFARDRALPVVITPGGGYGKDVEAMLAIRYEMLRTSLLP